MEEIVVFKREDDLKYPKYSLALLLTSGIPLLLILTNTAYLAYWNSFFSNCAKGFTLNFNTPKKILLYALYCV